MTTLQEWRDEHARARLRDFIARGGRHARLSRGARRLLGEVAFQPDRAEYDVSTRWHRAALELAAAGLVFVRVNGERWLAVVCTAEGVRRSLP